MFLFSCAQEEPYPRYSYVVGNQVPDSLKGEMAEWIN